MSLLRGALVAGLLLTVPVAPALCAERTRVTSQAPGPVVSDLHLDQQEIVKDHRLYVERDFEIELSACIRLGTAGSAVAPEGIRVLMHGRPLTSGKRVYDPASGHFTLTLSSQEMIAQMMPTWQDFRPEQTGARPALFEIVATDAAGREGRASFTPDRTAAAINVTLGRADEYGRTVPATDAPEPAVPVRALDRPVSLTSDAIQHRAPLALVLEHQTPVAHPDAVNDDASLGRASGDRVALTFSTRTGAHIGLLDPASGRLSAIHATFVTPKGTVWRAQWNDDHPYVLALASAQRSVVQAVGTDRRVVLPAQEGYLSPDDGAVDFVADPAGVTYSWGSFGVDLVRCDWQGHEQWRRTPWELFPGTEVANNFYDLPLAVQPDGTLMAFMYGSDDHQPGNHLCAGVAHVGPNGHVLASRMAYFTADTGRRFTIIDGAGALFHGRRLMILNLARFAQDSTDCETEIWDMDADAARPALVIPAGSPSPLEVYGTVVAGDRLIVGCGIGGVAVLRAN